MNSTLILLVGSNPLPNYLAALALRPERIGLVYTAETESAKQRLKLKLPERLKAASFVNPDPFISDATSAIEVRRVIANLANSDERDNTVMLNYTGGTKVMAAHARIAFEAVGRESKYASYLDEGGLRKQPRLRFDDGTSRPLGAYDISIDLDVILGLHGIIHKPRHPKHPAPLPQDAHEILCKTLGDVTLARTLFVERKRLEAYRNARHAVAEPFQASEHDLNLSLKSFPSTEQLEALANANARESWFKQWYKFIGGEWLEEWLGAEITGLNLTPAPEITVGVNAFRGTAQAALEVDVAVVRGYRTYLISCTTDVTKDLCKSKLFEIAVRSRQLGGDLARAALVCLADDKIVAALQQDITDVWGASNTTQIFGLSDVRAWADCNGQHGNQHSLKTWLES